MYAPKNEDVCENIKHKNYEYREEIYAGEEGRPLRMCGPWKCCSPPKEVARSPPEESVLRRHVTWSPWAAAQRSNKSHIAGREETGRGAKTVEKQREAMKSGQ